MKRRTHSSLMNTMDRYRIMTNTEYSVLKALGRWAEILFIPRRKSEVGTVTVISCSGGETEALIG